MSVRIFRRLLLGTAVLMLVSLIGERLTGFARHFDGEILSVRVLQAEKGDPSLDGPRLQIGSIAFPSILTLVSSVTAAENITLQNVTLTIGTTIYRMARVEVVGSNLGQPQFAELFKKDASEPLVTRLAAFSATSMTIPELIVERTMANGKQTISVRNVVLRNIISGKAEAISSSSGTVKGPGELDANFGAGSGANLDLALTARYFNEQAGLGDPGVKLLLGSLTVEKVHFKGPTGALIDVDRAAMSNISAPFGENMRRLFPVFGTLKITGANADVPRANIKNERQKASLKELTVTASEPRDGIPTKFRFAVDNFALVVPRNSADPSYKNLTDLGYESLVLSFLADGDWNASTNELIVKQFGVSGVDIGAVSLSGTLGKFTKDIFSGDGERARVALKDATVKTMSVSVENKGLFEHALAREAKRQGKSPEEVRKQYISELTAALPLLIGGPTSTTDVGSAVSKFLVKPGKMSINAKSKAPAGVPLIDFYVEKGTAPKFMGKLDVNATVE